MVVSNKSEAKFDAEDRKKYLTGFRKRKQARKEAAHKAAQETERQQRIVADKEKRFALKLQFKQIQYAKRKAARWQLPKEELDTIVHRIKNAEGGEGTLGTGDNEGTSESEGSSDIEATSANPFLIQGEKSLSAAFYGSKGKKVVVQSSDTLDSIL